MTRLFDDEQTTSLIRAMANPESNARKMAEQNQEIGVPSDITKEPTSVAVGAALIETG